METLIYLKLCYKSSKISITCIILFLITFETCGANLVICIFFKWGKSVHLLLLTESVHIFRKSSLVIVIHAHNFFFLKFRVLKFNFRVGQIWTFAHKYVYTFRIRLKSYQNIYNKSFYSL